ncbi:MAG: hypothetical protein ABSG93_00500 [Solirubrobacteraceae bacterium]|jgi:hypothetical protein
MAVALAQLASLHLSLPIALGGEAETSNNTGIGIISVVSIGLGYVGLFALWFFVFRDKSRSKRKKDSSER